MAEELTTECQYGGGVVSGSMLASTVIESAAAWLRLSLPNREVEPFSVDMPRGPGLAVVGIFVGEGRCAVGCLVADDGTVSSWDILRPAETAPLLVEAYMATIYYAAAEEQRSVRAISSRTLVVEILRLCASEVFERVEFESGVSLEVVSPDLPVSLPALVDLYSRHATGPEIEDLFDASLYVLQLVWRGHASAAWSVLRAALLTVSADVAGDITMGELESLIRDSSDEDIAIMQKESAASPRLSRALEVAIENVR